MNTIEIASLIAPIISVCIGLLAIWLSVFFYRMSSQLSESAKEAAKGIGASVDRLEKLFDKLYSDTFSMMKDTVSDMRKHIWPEGTKSDDAIAEEAEKKADEKVSILKKNIGAEITKVLERQSRTDIKVEQITQEFKKIVDRVITESRKVEMEAREETVREHIIKQLKHDRPITASELINIIARRFPSGSILNELDKMKREGIIFWKEDGIGPESLIRLM